MRRGRGGELCTAKPIKSDTMTRPANYHVSVKSGYPLVNIRRWFVPEGQEEPTPTKSGIALTFLQWEKLKSAMILVEEVLDGELDKVSVCEETHQSQEGALTCSICSPTDFKNH